VGNIIIVGVDGSETADSAATAAARLAADTGASLHVITAYDKGAVDERIEVGADTWVLSSTDNALQTAESVAGRLRGIHPDVTPGVGEGKPADVLLKAAERLDAKVIVVGNRRMQGIGRVLGSVANTVAHNAPCDVYIVKTV
jgi:nucleotide-binding universal stress UspA family protein